MSEHPDGHLARVWALTQTFDDQVDLFDDILGPEPLALTSSQGGGELSVAGPDPSLLIHAERGTDRVAVGWSMEQVRESLGAADSVNDLNDLLSEAGKEWVWSVYWNYYAQGLEVEFKEERVVKLVFHSGGYPGGLLGTRYAPYAGAISPDLPLTCTRAEIEAAYGKPAKLTRDDPELAEALEESVLTSLVYPGITFRVLDSGELEQVCVPQEHVK